MRIEPTAQQQPASRAMDSLRRPSGTWPLRASRQAERFSPAFLRLRDLRVGKITTALRISGMLAIGVMSKQKLLSTTYTPPLMCSEGGATM